MWLPGTTASSIEPEPVLNGREIKVRRYFFCCLLYRSRLLTPEVRFFLNVGINPTRDGMLRVCRAMGWYYSSECKYKGEPTADLLIRTSSLHGTTVEGEIIHTDRWNPDDRCNGSFAEEYCYQDAQELKAKESDRIAVVTEGLKHMELIFSRLMTEWSSMEKATSWCRDQFLSWSPVAMSFAVAGTICDGTLLSRWGLC